MLGLILSLFREKLNLIATDYGILRGIWICSILDNQNHPIIIAEMSWRREMQPSSASTAIRRKIEIQSYLHCVGFAEGNLSLNRLVVTTAI